MTETVLLATVSALAAEKVLTAPIENLTLAEQVQARVALKAAMETLEARIEVLKGALIPYADAKGVPEGEKGTVAVIIDGSKVAVQHKVHTLPDNDGMLDLCKLKGIALDEVSDEVKSRLINPSKIHYLVQTGKLSQTEVDSLKRKDTALRIYPSKALKALIAPFKALTKLMKGKAEEVEAGEE